MKKKKRTKSLWWSSLTMYENCPKKFQYKYGSPGVPPVEAPPRSEHYISMGVVIQEVIEDFYNDRLWLTDSGEPRPTKELVNLLVAITRNKFRNDIQGRYVDWTWAKDEGTLLDTCVKGVLGYLKTLKEHSLIGEENVCEKRMIVDMGGYAIGAKPDVIIKNTSGPNEGIMIVDGKNTLAPESDVDQLRLYALIFYRKYGVMPNKLGFVWYRYPAGSKYPDGTPSTGITWITCDKGDFEGLALRCEQARKGISEQKFPANPVPKYCKYCDWEDLCEERQEQRLANAAKRKKKKPEPISGKDIGGGFLIPNMSSEESDE